MEMLEAVLVKVTNKFTYILQMMMAQLVGVINDRFTAKLAHITDRLDAIEVKLMTTAEPPAVATNSAMESPQAVIEAATRHAHLLAVEREKEETRQRTCNVIVTGLAPSSSKPDMMLIEELCENHLTIKPHIIRTRRLGMTRRLPAPNCVLPWRSQRCSMS